MCANCSQRGFDAASLGGALRLLCLAINLLVEEKKVRFEINLAAIARAKLMVRSSLLHRAVRTIDHDRLEAREDEENSSGKKRP